MWLRRQPWITIGLQSVQVFINATKHLLSLVRLQPVKSMHNSRFPDVHLFEPTFRKNRSAPYRRYIAGPTQPHCLNALNTGKRRHGPLHKSKLIRDAFSRQVCGG
jgi:hypothetical protein